MPRGSERSWPEEMKKISTAVDEMAVFFIVKETIKSADF
jgi:hypothetical protein